MSCRLKKILTLFCSFFLLIPVGINSANSEVLQEENFTYKLLDDGSVMITAYQGAEQELVIPDMLNQHPVSVIDSWAFDHLSNLEKIILPAGLVEIRDNAICSCGIVSVEIPASVTFIGYSAFDSCNHLESVSFASGGFALFLNNTAFSQCEKLESVSFPSDRPIQTDGNPFVGTSILRFSVPSEHPNLATYQGVLFDKKEKKLIAYPDQKEESVYEIPPGIKAIGAYAFHNSFLESITIPDTVSRIDLEAFSCSSLQELSIPDSVSLIGSGAFDMCFSLKHIHLGAGVRHIGSGSFLNCGMLTEISVSDDNPFFYAADGVLFAKNPNRLVWYPTARPGDFYMIPDGITSIDPSVFSDTSLHQYHSTCTDIVSASNGAITASILM